MKIWYTRRFHKEAQSYAMQGELARITSDLESRSDEEATQLFAQSDVAPYYWKEAKGRSRRLIGKEYQFNGHRVFCFLCIQHINEAKCQAFKSDPTGWGKEHLDPLVEREQEEIEKWLAELDATGDDLSVRNQPIPEALLPWLDPVDCDVLHDEATVIYETDEWVGRFRNPDIDDYWQTYHRLLLRLMEGGAPDRRPAGFPEAGLFVDGTRAILALSFDCREQRPSRIVVLLSPFCGLPSNEELRLLLREKLGSARSAPGAQQRLSEEVVALVAPLSRRCYPDYLVYDQESWRAIEKESQSNLALSPEERAVLSGVALRSSPPQPMPLFVDGPAGSGKSTMLMHVFAAYCDRKNSNPKLEGTPLFLTVSQALLNTAQEGVERLLSTNAKYLMSRNATPVLSNLQIADCFKPFRRFVLELLADSDRGKFPSDKEITFARFKRLFNGTPAAGEEGLQNQLPRRAGIGPELCWHAIRTIIKGRDPDRVVDPNSYPDLQRDDRVLVPDTFKFIYENIWERWYQPRVCELGGYWDDQDVVRAVLNAPQSPPPRYPAIFCDEAQDFTRLDLRLILQLWAMSPYDASLVRPLSVPFMFAGDPLQTLSPTGFRWDALKSAFHDEILRGIDPQEKTQLQISFVPLRQNYRSSRPIVRLLNLVQAWRARLFDLKYIHPQRAWGTAQGLEPQKLVLGQDISHEALANQIVNTPVIIPAEEGEERAFIEKNSDLKAALGINPTASFNTVPKNIYTAASIKGLEFERVVLYRFGDAADPKMWQLLEGKAEERPVAEEYFFNKLYVAASRATKQMIIIDTKEGDQRLWQRMEDISPIEHLADQSWPEFILPLPIRSGGSETIAEFHNENPLNIADELRTKGMSQRNAEHLQKAAQYFRSIDMRREALICQAFALKFDSDWLEAGRTFEELGKEYPESEGDIEALSCYWQGGCDRDLVRLPFPRLRSGHGEKFAVATFLCSPPNDTAAIRQLNQDLEPWLSGEQCSVNEPQWRRLIDQYHERLRSLPPTDLDQAAWQACGRILNYFVQRGRLEAADAAGRCFFAANLYSQAVQAWRISVSPNNQASYFRAQASQLSYPADLEYWEKAGDYGRVVEEWRKHGQGAGPELVARALELVARALEKEGEFAEALRIYLRLEVADKAMELRQKLVGLPSEDVTSLLGQLRELLVKRRDWHRLATLLNEIERYPTSHLVFRGESLRIAVEALAWSDEALRSDEDRWNELVHTVLSRRGWENHLSLTHAALAVERLNMRVLTAIQFYESLMEASAASERDFARRRWVACKLRLERYHEGRHEPERALEHGRDARASASRWQINWKTIEELPPDLSQVSPGPALRRSAVAFRLPKGCSARPESDGRHIIPLGDHVILVDEAKRFVRVKARDDSFSMRIDLVSWAVSGDDLTVRPGDAAIKFDKIGGVLSGTVDKRDGKVLVKLSVEGQELGIDFSEKG